MRSAAASKKAFGLMTSGGGQLCFGWQPTRLCFFVMTWGVRSGLLSILRPIALARTGSEVAFTPRLRVLSRLRRFQQVAERVPMMFGEDECVRVLRVFETKLVDRRRSDESHDRALLLAAE